MMKPAAKKPASVSLQEAIKEVEREINRIVGLESDPVLRTILSGKIDLSIANIADYIKTNFIERNVVCDSNGAPDPALTTINDLPHLLDCIHRSLEETKKSYFAEVVGYILGFFSIPDEFAYWAKKPTLVANQAIPLMNGLDPGSWRNRDKRMRPEHPLPDDMAEAILTALQIAESDGAKAKSPAEWLAWGQEHGLDKPTMKSHQKLSEPDVCMWPLFAQAVAEEIERNPKKEAAPAAKVESAQGTSPSCDNTIGTAGIVYWRVILYSNIKKIDAHGKANVRDIIKYLRSLGDRRLPDKGEQDELLWIDDNKTELRVQKKTVGNAASAARKLP